MTWPTIRAKYLFCERDERVGHRDLPLLSVSALRGVVPRSELTADEPRADDLSRYKVCEKDDLVINRMSAYQGALGVAPRPGIVSPDYTVLRPLEIEPGYAHHLVRSAWFVGEMTARLRGIGGSDQGNVRTPRINTEDFGQILVSLPPRQEQREIGDFLDSETARIDALIENKRQMIVLLEARWEASVRHRLRDLAPRMPLKRRWRVTDCKHRTPVYVDAGYPVTSPGDLSPGRIDLSRCHRFVDDVDFNDLTEGRRPNPGDIIYSRNASAGIASYVETDQPFCMGQDVCLITSPDQDQRFLMYALNTVGADQLVPIKIGSTITRINVDQIGELEMPAPPVETQRQVADELDRERERVDQLVRRIRRQLELLREHRQALIAAAVTGELDLAKAV